MYRCGIVLNVYIFFYLFRECNGTCASWNNTKYKFMAFEPSQLPSHSMFDTHFSVNTPIKGSFIFFISFKCDYSELEDHLIIYEKYSLEVTAIILVNVQNSARLRTASTFLESCGRHKNIHNSSAQAIFSSLGSLTNSSKFVC